MISNFFSEANALWVLMGTTLLGLCSGVLGSFAFLRKRGLMGDVLAHAALPGICFAFLLTGSKNLLFFLIGAILSGILASFCIQWITEWTRIKEDTALGLVLSVFFGIGIVLLTQIQHSDYGNQSGLDKFLFGQSAAMVEEDVWLIGGIAFLILLVCILFFKEFKLLCFDPAFAKSLGFPVKQLDFFLMFLLVVTVVIGLQAVGVVLMTALLITPAAAARYWTENLKTMLILSAIMGAISGVLGTMFSATAENLSTGPIIVLAATIIFFLSMLLAPKRGLLARWWRHIQLKKRLAKEKVLVELYQLAEKNGSPILSLESLPSREKTLLVLEQLEKENLIRFQQNQLEFTEKGWQKAYETVLYQRMIEMWIMYENHLSTDLSYQQIENLEQIPQDLQKQLKELMRQHEYEPKWQMRKGVLCHE